MSKWLWCLCKVVTVFSTGLIPYLSRMASETEGVATGNDRKLYPQVSVPFPPLALVTDSARTTLSRWRHGFEPRWDYREKRRSEALSSLSDDSALPFVPHLSRGRPRHVTGESPRGRPGRVSRSTQSRRRICSKVRDRDEQRSSQDPVEGNGPRADRHSRQGAHEGPTTARTGAFVIRQRPALGEDNRRSISSGSATWARLGAVLWAGAGSHSGRRRRVLDRKGRTLASVESREAKDGGPSRGE